MGIKFAVVYIMCIRIKLFARLRYDNGLTIGCLYIEITPWGGKQPFYSRKYENKIWWVDKTFNKDEVETSKLIINFYITLIVSGTIATGI